MEEYPHLVVIKLEQSYRKFSSHLILEFQVSLAQQELKAL